MAIVNGSRYRAIRSGPASTGSKPTSRMRRAATSFASWSSPQYRRLGRRRRRRLAAKTSKKTSLGTVPKADTTSALRTFLASASAPDVGFEPVDAGDLKIARYLEPFTLVIAQLAYEGDGGPEIAYRIERFGKRRR